MGRHLATAKARTHKETSLLLLHSSTPQRNIKDKKMRAVMIALLPLAAVKALSPMELMVEEWETWKVEHGKNYGHGLLGSTGNSVGGGVSQTEHFRMKIWMENKAKIEKHNRLAHKGHKSYHLAMNQFGDLLHHEFAALMNGYQSRSKFNYTGTTGTSRSRGTRTTCAESHRPPAILLSRSAASKAAIPVFQSSSKYSFYECHRVVR